MTSEDIFDAIFNDNETIESDQVEPKKEVEKSDKEESDNKDNVLSKPAKEPKLDNIDLSKEKIVEESKTDLKHEFEQIKKRLEDSKAWGHKKNSAYINAKKKMTDFLNKLQEEGAIFEEQAVEALGFFNAKDEELIESEKKENVNSPFIEVKEKLDKEFSMFKKYAKVDNAEEKYNSFFYFWTMLTPQEQDETLTYLQEEEPSVALDKIMTTGSKLHDTIILPINKHGGLVPFVESLQDKNIKLQEKINKLQSELDGTTEKVYSRSITSNVSNPQQSRKVTDFLDFLD